MPPRIFANIESPVLRWARESAGLSVEAAAKKISVTPEKLAVWEEGDEKPSVPQLRKAASVYKRPLAVFFLSRPPDTPSPPHDFRRLDSPRALEGSPALMLELRRARRRRQVALELATEQNDQSIYDFPIEARADDDPESLADMARDWLGITVRQQSTWRGEYGPLNGWLATIESKGVLVFQTSDVDLNEMRGFSISEYPIPAIVLNATDAPRGRAFTLAHELVHLFIRNGGICDPLRVSGAGRSENERVEAFCNRVAGAIMVPADDLVRHPAVAAARRPQDWDDSILRELADRYAVSREVVLRRLLILDKTTQRFYEAKHSEYGQQFADSRAQAKLEGGFAPYSRVVVRDLGKKYTRMVLEALERDQITPADVSDYLGINLKHLVDIADAAQMPGGDV
jgi:Zn-dependent peptidase ImmA (M78 family)/transcriptional regulator with XRE-family HTH domain